MDVIEVNIKTIYNDIHISIDSLDDISEIVSQPYVTEWSYKKVNKSNYKKLQNINHKENNNGEKIYRKTRTNIISRDSK